MSNSLSSSLWLGEISHQVTDIHVNTFLEILPRSKIARHDFERPDHPTSCLPGTREAVLSDIEDWTRSHDPESLRFYWLKGMAGIGKTTVARSVAEKAQSSGLLGASFFFSRRGEAELRDPSRVFPTIAYQLARYDRSFGKRIVRALENDPEAAHRSLPRQLDDLIITPLQDAPLAPKRVVIIVFDAFDECEATGAQLILHLIVAALPRLPLFLKIFITSRDEPHIRKVLEPAHGVGRAALQDIEHEVVRGDIRTYLCHELGRIGAEQEPPLSESWVSEKSLDALTDAAGTLFIHAATSIRYLSSSDDPIEGLQSLFRVFASPSRHRVLGQTHQLDQLYQDLLLRTMTPENASEVAPRQREVVGTLILLRDPLPLDSLERLIGLKQGFASKVLGRLRSIILPPVASDDPPRIYHPSFSDFIQDSARCTDPQLCIKTCEHEARIARQSLELMNRHLHLNMLGESDTRLLNDKVVDLNDKVTRVFRPDLRYVCLFWASHLVEVPLSLVDKGLLLVLKEFTGQKLLAWLESLSLLDGVEEGIQSMEALHAWMVRARADFAERRQRVFTSLF